MTRFRRITLFVLIGFVLLIVLLPVVTMPVLVRRSFPETDGEIRLSGLDGAVDIYRDGFGVPHIYASTQHDLFFTQGYIHAQDRFWQMDFWRHSGAGRLSELLGESTLEIDRYLRTLGWERVAQEELANMDPDSLLILEAYAQGVNAYLAGHQGGDLSLEYVFLNLINWGYQPKPWESINTLTWAKAMAWDLGGNMNSEINRALLMKHLTSEQVEQIFPPYDFDRPVIVRNPHITTSDQSNLEDTDWVQVVTSGLESVRKGIDALDGLRGVGFEGIGSNSWVIAGDRTESGMPMLANDPHLGAQIPSIWYEIGLHCVPKGPECPFEVSGFSFAGAPGVIIGHNDRIAWGATNLGPDVMDLYIEKINPENPNQYEVNGQWVDMDLIEDAIRIAGGDPVPITVRLTRHGPVLSDISLDDFKAEAGIDLPEHYAISLRWTALEPNFIFRAFWRMNKAQNWEEFREATRDFAVPSQNLVYADVDGNIGYQTPGNIPIRNPEHTGLLPVPGWTDDYEWQGYIPFEELPFTFNPPEGYIVTANNAVVSPEYPYSISHQWRYGYRAQRIVDMIEAAPGGIDIAYNGEMQRDNLDLNAERLVPILMNVPLEDSGLQSIRARLMGWDYQAGMDSGAAAIFEVFWKNLLFETFSDDLPEFFQASGGDRWFEVVGHLVDDPESFWWDDKNTPEVENRDAIFARAFDSAVAELKDELGNDPDDWSWGDLHTLTFRHEVMSNFPLINKLFNRGPFQTSGGSAIVNATSWSTSRSPSYQVEGLPSMRMIVDLSDFQNSRTMHTTGQSGHAYHLHYIDMTDPWRLFEYHPMNWDRHAVETDAEGHLRLLP